jgi:hypothetical protein
LECGDLSPLFPLGRLVGQAAPRGAARRITKTGRFTRCDRITPFDGDTSPAKSGDKSPQSMAGASFITSW